MSGCELPRIVCVDDEPRVIEGLVLYLRKDYRVHTASNGEEALRVLKEIGGASVIVSDMRMPGMNGAALLQRVMSMYPDMTRILLTGEPGRDTAVAAVNESQVFRFLTKPCPPEQLKAALEAGVMQHRLLQAERAILQETLIGCIQALMDVLAVNNPVAFARASRVKRLAADFADSLDCGAYWQLEAAAMLSQLRYVTLPGDIGEKLYSGERLTPDEQLLAKAAPDVVGKLSERIARLEPVIQILAALTWSDQQVTRLRDGTVGLGARILRLVLQYDELIAQGHPVEVAVRTLRARCNRFGEDLVERFARHVGPEADGLGISHER